MNKLILANKVIDNLINDEINFEYKDNLIPKIVITIFKDTELTIEFDCLEEIKWELEFKIEKNCTAEIIEIKKGEKIKILSKYILSSNCNVKIIEVNDVFTINERNFIDLIGENSKLTYILKTIGVHSEKYDIVVNHKAKNTESDIYNHAVNQTGTTTMNVSTAIEKNMTGSIANQHNRIINLTNNPCVIRPNLLIDEYDCLANHSAYVGTFTKEELFYMNRLGLDDFLANQLLIKGFINSKVNNNITTLFEKYWR